VREIVIRRSIKLMSVRDGFAGYYGNFGIRGVLAISANRLFGRPKEITAHPRCIQSALRLRVRTSDLSTYTEILLRGEYAFDLPFSPRTIVDAGANIGMASIYFAHRYPEAKIIAIEPEASNFAVLARNVQPYPTIKPVHAAVWNQDGEVHVGEPDPETGASGKWSFVTRRQGTGDTIRAVTLPTLMREFDVDVIDLAKIDIEGSEQEIFEDTRWLTGLRCMMIELHDRFRPGCSKAVEPAMQGFNRLQRGETTFYLREI
jgi:FkbM family methyltransferase